MLTLVNNSSMDKGQSNWNNFYTNCSSIPLVQISLVQSWSLKCIQSYLQVLMNSKIWISIEKYLWWSSYGRYQKWINKRGKEMTRQANWKARQPSSFLNGFDGWYSSRLRWRVCSQFAWWKLFIQGRFVRVLLRFVLCRVLQKARRGIKESLKQLGFHHGLLPCGYEQKITNSTFWIVRFLLHRNDHWTWKSPERALTGNKDGGK